VPSLMRWIDLCVFLLPDATRTLTTLGPDHLAGLAASTQKYRSGTLTQWTPDNSPEAKNRKSCVTSTDGGVRPSEKCRHEPLTGGHDRPPSRRGPITAGHNTPEALTARRRHKKERMKTATSGANGNGPQRPTTQGRYRLPDACRLQGLPEDFLSDAPFTAEGKLKAVANGVPIPMGRAIAKAIKEAVTPASSSPTAPPPVSPRH
jgi:site-specific DNA-cytosine methylase